MRTLLKILAWLFKSTPSCDRADCTEDSLCDDCLAFWAIK